MSNEEIVKEIVEATRLMKETKTKINDTLCHARTVVEREVQIPYSEAYNKGLEDGYGLGKKLWVAEIKGGLNTRIVEEIFDCDIYDVYTKYTPQEALAKLEAYEKEQAEIKVGDVVTIFPRSGGQYDAIVVLTKSQGYIDAIYSDGVTTNNVPPELYKKTGKHIDIQSVLQQIGGGSDD